VGLIHNSTKSFTVNSFTERLDHYQVPMMVNAFTSCRFPGLSRSVPAQDWGCLQLFLGWEHLQLE